ncbi:MAG: YncE family protein, partial [Bacteroidetes bacterium]|nr:YncE family protein [Bacteroidota bacterium]
MRPIYIAIFIAIGFVSCKKENTIGPVNINAEKYEPIDTTSSAVFVINEGNFQWGNSSITHYNLENGVVTQDVFQGANNGMSLGDVAQSMVIHDSKGFIVVDNSNKIEVVEIDSFSSVGTITGLVAPRYIQIINSSKAYVTDLYAGYISIFNPSTLAITGQVNVPGHTEEMVMVNNKVYVTNM